MFVVKNDGRNDHKIYKSIYFNYFFTCYYRVRLFLAMQVRVMTACLESQADILECTASAQSGRREVTVCFFFRCLCIILISDQLLFSFPLSNTTGTLISINGKK